MPSPHLTVARPTLIAALTKTKKFRGPKRNEEAVFSFYGTDDNFFNDRQTVEETFT